MLVYAVRHAESLTNADRAAEPNCGLSALGERQVAALAKRFRAVGASAIYSSPYRRCIETALPIGRALNLPVRLRPELCEYHHLEPGRPIETGLEDLDVVVARHPELIPCPDHQGEFAWPPSDEPFQSVLARTSTFASFLKDRWQAPEDGVVLISHGSPVARLIDVWLTEEPGPWFRFILDNAAVSALRCHEGVSTLVCLNESSHLQGLPSPSGANLNQDGSVKAVPPSNYW